ncbi:MAG: hypothetical protein IPK16_28875 [Anaerolineales bacterium]|nr:hypothetical protein [Anaerolineales bacterium]
MRWWCASRGDPFVFGRGGEEMVYCRRGGCRSRSCRASVVQVAAAGAVGVPVTHRELSSSFAVVAGHLSAGSAREPNWQALAQIDTLVILMGLRNLARIADTLMAAGRSSHTAAMVVCAATLPWQETVVAPLGQLATAAAHLAQDSPATIIVGDVVDLAMLAPVLAIDMGSLLEGELHHAMRRAEGAGATEFTLAAVGEEPADSDPIPCLCHARRCVVAAEVRPC